MEFTENLDLYNRIIEEIKAGKFEYKETRHAPVRTSEEAAKVRGTSLNEGAKALVCTSDKGYLQLVIPGDKRVDKEKVKKILNLNKFKLAGADEAEKLSGVEVGGVPPFGNLFPTPIKIYVSQSVLRNTEIEFNAGHRGISLRMKAKDWEQIVKPEIGDFDE